MKFVGYRRDSASTDLADGSLRVLDSDGNVIEVSERSNEWRTQ
jgi:hypothetical protein